MKQLTRKCEIRVNPGITNLPTGPVIPVVSREHVPRSRRSTIRNGVGESLSSQEVADFVKVLVYGESETHRSNDASAGLLPFREIAERTGKERPTCAVPVRLVAAATGT